MIIAILTTILLQCTVEPPFKKVELQRNNEIFVSGLPSYYDTIINSGLYLSSISGKTVFVNTLGDELSDSYQAVIHYEDGYYYLFIAELDKREAIEVIAHEIQHIKQYSNNQLDLRSDQVITWQGEEYGQEIEYDNRPWERQAFNLGPRLAAEIRDYLW